MTAIKYGLEWFVSMATRGLCTCRRKHLIKFVWILKSCLASSEVSIKDGGRACWRRIINGARTQLINMRLIQHTSTALKATAHIFNQNSIKKPAPCCQHQLEVRLDVTHDSTFIKI